MGELKIVTSADRHDLDEQVSAVFRPVWPEFIFHDPISGLFIMTVIQSLPLGITTPRS